MNATKPTLASLCADITKMVALADNTETKWKSLGEAVHGFFGAESEFDKSIDAIRAAVIAGFKTATRSMIEMDKKEAKALTAEGKAARKAAQTQLSNRVNDVRRYAWPKIVAKAAATPDPVLVASTEAARQKAEAAKAAAEAKAALAKAALQAKLAKMNFEQAPEAGKKTAKAALTKANAALTKATKAAEAGQAEADAKAEAAKAAQANLQAKQEADKADKAKADLKAKLEAALKTAQETSVENVASICNTLRDLIAKI